MKVRSHPPEVTAQHFQWIPFSNYNFQDRTLRNRLRPTLPGQTFQWPFRSKSLFHATHIEFPWKTPYAKDADEFVRLSCRGSAGWRRDEWAYSPLFIWCKSLPEMGADLAGPPANRTQQGGVPSGGIRQILMDLQQREEWRQSWTKFERQRNGWPHHTGWMSSTLNSPDRSRNVFYVCFLRKTARDANG